MFTVSDLFGVWGFGAHGSGFTGVSGTLGITLKALGSVLIELSKALDRAKHVGLHGLIKRLEDRVESLESLGLSRLGLQALPIVSIVVPFCGLTNYILRIL